MSQRPLRHVERLNYELYGTVGERQASEKPVKKKSKRRQKFTSVPLPDSSNPVMEHGHTPAMSSHTTPVHNYTLPPPGSLPIGTSKSVSSTGKTPGKSSGAGLFPSGSVSKKGSKKALNMVLVNQKLDDELDELQAQLDEAEIVISKRRQITDIKQKLDKLMQDPTESLKPTVPSQKKLGDGMVTLSQLRESEKLADKVNMKYKDYLDSDSTSTDTSDDDATPIKRGKKKTKSGLVQKASDNVKKRQLFPHVSLKYSFVHKNLSFKDLDFQQFVTGELETITRVGISEEEKEGRLRLLKHISYYEKTYEWEKLRALYVAVVRSVEDGINTWSSDYSAMERMILIHTPTELMASTVKKSTKSVDKSPTAPTRKGGTRSGRVVLPDGYFCSLYNKNHCSESKSHMGKHKGKEVLLEHVCATCFLKGEKSFHSESSSDCPIRA